MASRELLLLEEAANAALNAAANFATENVPPKGDINPLECQRNISHMMVGMQYELETALHNADRTYFDSMCREYIAFLIALRTAVAQGRTLVKPEDN